MAPLLKEFKKEGFIKRKEETLHQLFIRYLDAKPKAKEIYHIDRLYHEIRYGNAFSKIKELKIAISKFLNKNH